MTYLNLAIETGFALAGGFALWSIYDSVKQARRHIVGILTDIHSLQHLQINQASAGEAGITTFEQLITCGGCGRTVLTENGFDPLPHGCDGVENALLAK